MSDLDLLTEHADTERPFDRWPADNCENHISAEGISLHAHRRMGGPPLFALGIVGIATEVIVKLNEKHGVDILDEEVDAE